MNKCYKIKSLDEFIKKFKDQEMMIETICGLVIGLQSVNCKSHFIICDSYMTVDELREFYFDTSGSKWNTIGRLNFKYWEVTVFDNKASDEFDKLENWSGDEEDYYIAFKYEPEKIDQ